MRGPGNPAGPWSGKCLLVESRILGFGIRNPRLCWALLNPLNYVGGICKWNSGEAKQQRKPILKGPHPRNQPLPIESPSPQKISAAYRFSSIKSWVECCSFYLSFPLSFEKQQLSRLSSACGRRNETPRRTREKLLLSNGLEISRQLSKTSKYFKSLYFSWSSRHLPC